jgi:signal peptidase I
MLNFLERRRRRKAARELLHHARHVRNMREDIAPQPNLDALLEAERNLEEAVRSQDAAAMDRASGKVEEAVYKLAPPRAHAGLRENLEVLVVAFAVAMGFRTYFVQPFKIPTGSMQPTLYGIHYEVAEKAGIMDVYPLKAAKWLLFGAWYCEFPARASGVLQGPVGHDADGNLVYYIGGVPHSLPRDITLRFRPGTDILAGQVLARAVRITGDHIFVNKVKWNFVRPHRGEIMVFNTDGIPALNDKKTHYIKRMVGVPGEKVGIDPPNLVIDGKVPSDSAMIRRIQGRLPDYTGEQNYAGYVIPPTDPNVRYIRSRTDFIYLKAGEYLGFGDNTLNSYDGRYWGPVPQGNLVGPAWLVYWPLSRRWGVTH